ncbi:MAG TPA: hypothetical protein VLE21_03680, partial [Candidatus Nitrosocosmicus sp.]|nr:hypothetical protein [Candidatus Nitrosocosmicus sp.]
VVPETLKNVRDSSKYVLITMGILASLTLILGVYPDLLYKPIIGYVQNLYDETPDELIPIKINPDSSNEQVQTNTTTTMTTTTTTTTNNAIVTSTGEEGKSPFNRVYNNLGTEMAQKTHLISGNHLVSYVTI